MTEDFDEARQSDSADALDKRVVEIDFAAMDEEQVPIKFIQVDAACDGLRALASYQLGSDCDSINKRALEAIGKRVIAMWWTVNPAYFDGSPSLAALAKRMSVDDTGLSRLTAQLTRAFGTKNRAQAHGDGRRGK